MVVTRIRVIAMRWGPGLGLELEAFITNVGLGGSVRVSLSLRVILRFILPVKVSLLLSIEVRLQIRLGVSPRVRISVSPSCSGTKSIRPLSWAP